MIGVVESSLNACETSCRVLRGLLHKHEMEN